MPGVYAAAADRATAKRAIRSALEIHLKALKEEGRVPASRVDLLVLRSEAGKTFRFAGIGALVGHRTSAARTKAARLNGRKGGVLALAVQRMRVDADGRQIRTIEITFGGCQKPYVIPAVIRRNPDRSQDPP